MSRQEEINEKLKPFFAKPISEEAKQYHREFKHHENKELPSSKEFCLINIWGLITKKENKKEILRKLTEPRTNKIITITETHLSSAQHYDVEITKYTFIITIYTEQAERHKVQARGWPLILSGGGFMLMTSPDIVTQPALIFSNCYCKLLIT